MIAIELHNLEFQRAIISELASRALPNEQYYCMERIDPVISTVSLLRLILECYCTSIYDSNHVRMLAA